MLGIALARPPAVLDGVLGVVVTRSGQKGIKGKRTEKKKENKKHD